MTAKTILQFQFGGRSAIDAVARSKAALITGVVLVLITSIPRNYDQLAISEQPLRWLFGPLIFSAGSGTFLFVFVYLLRTALSTKHGKVEKTQGLIGSWIGFMGLFWMTAPVAWLYAIPVERLIGDPVDQARANLILLAIVSAWRVCLMARVMQVACRWNYGRALAFLLATACVEVLVLVFYSPALARSIFSGMGGMRNSPAEDLLLSAMMTTAMAALFIFPAMLILGVFGPGKESIAALPIRTGDRVPRLALAGALVAWLAVSIQPQLEVFRNARLDDLVEDGEYRAAIELMNGHEADAFSPSRELPPNEYEWEIFKFLPALMAVVEEDDADWVQDHLLSRLDRMLRHLVRGYDRDDLNHELDPERNRQHYGPRWQSVNASAWQPLFEGLERTTKGQLWLEKHPNLKRRIEAEAEADSDPFYFSLTQASSPF